MKQLIVIETLQALPGKSELLKQALLEMVPLTLQETGCLNYEIAESENHKEIFLVLMRWKNRQDLEAHNQSAHIKTFVGKHDQVLYSEVTETHWYTCV